MIKDGYTNVNGVLIENRLNIITEPCPNCGCEDCEVVADLMFEPPSYKLKCANPSCGYTVPEEYARHRDYHDDGVVEASVVWNMLAYAASALADEPVVEAEGRLLDAETGEIIK